MTLLTAAATVSRNLGWGTRQIEDGLVDGGPEFVFGGRLAASHRRKGIYCLQVIHKLDHPGESVGDKSVTKYLFV